MSLLTQLLILERYGPRLGVTELAAVLDIEKKTVYNKISDGTFSIPTYVDGGKRWADHRDVAEYFDTMRAQAKRGAF